MRKNPPKTDIGSEKQSDHNFPVSNTNESASDAQSQCLIKLQSAPEFIEKVIALTVEAVIPPLNDRQLERARSEVAARFATREVSRIDEWLLPNRIAVFLFARKFEKLRPDIESYRDFPHAGTLSGRIRVIAKDNGHDLLDAFDVASLEQKGALRRWASALVKGSLQVATKPQDRASEAVAGALVEMTHDIHHLVVEQGGAPLDFFKRYQLLIFLAARFPNVVQSMRSFRQMADALFEIGRGCELAKELTEANRKLAGRNTPGKLPDPLLLVMAVNWTNAHLPLWMMETNAAIEALTTILGFHSDRPQEKKSVQENFSAITEEKYKTHRKRHFTKPKIYPIKSIRLEGGRVVGKLWNGSEIVAEIDLPVILPA